MPSHIKVEFMSDGRSILIAGGATYVDTNGKSWFVDDGDIADGASIPRFFWRLIGSPFVGRYREPSIFHDVYCKSKTQPHKMVHRMFYDAMLDYGVPKLKAKIMYWGVAWFGPKW